MADEPILGLDEPIDKIFTIPNVISLVRFCLIPLCVVFLFSGNNLVAAILFATAACTDFIDGTVARKTHTVSKLGQYLDPAIDRVAMMTGVICLVILDRLPLWIVILVVARDLYLLWGTARLKVKYNRRVPVMFAGKVATTFLFIGCAGLLLNLPLLKGLGWVNAAWLPGFSAGTYCPFIWSVYIGVCIGAVTTYLYIKRALEQRRQALEEATELGA